MWFYFFCIKVGNLESMNNTCLIAGIYTKKMSSLCMHKTFPEHNLCVCLFLSFILREFCCYSCHFFDFVCFNWAEFLQKNTIYFKMIYSIVITAREYACRTAVWYAYFWKPASLYHTGLMANIRPKWRERGSLWWRNKSAWGKYRISGDLYFTSKICC